DIASADLNEDNKPDLAVANGATGKVSVLLDSPHAPAAPSITGTNPASPSPQTSIYVQGSSQASLVQGFSGAGCTPLLNYGFHNFASAGIQVNVPANTTTSLSANTIDGDGTSSCSAPFTYTADSVAPAPPTFSAVSPSSPGNTTTPQVRGSAE